MSFLLDTDVCSAHLKGHAAVFARFLQYSGRLHVSTVTAAELYTWVLRAKSPPSRLVVLQDMLDGMTVLDLDRSIAHKCGEIRARLLDAGQPVASTDLLIAATALVNHLTLVTHNTADFANVPGLLLDDWLEK